MTELIVFGGVLLTVLLVRWGARRFYVDRPFSFYHDEAIYTRHGDGRFTTETGAIVADPDLLRLLANDWDIVSDPDRAGRTGHHAWPGYARDRVCRSGVTRALEAIGRFLDRFRL